MKTKKPYLNNLINNLRKFALSLLVVCSVYGISNAATITVTNILDGMPGSLRDAVSMASVGDTIVFLPTTDGLPQVLSAGEIALNFSINIFGNGPGNTIVDGNVSNRIFNINASGPVRLTDLEIRNGSSTSSGGAIFATGGVDLQINNCTITDSESTVAAAGEGGGGIAGDNAIITVMESDINGNTASGTSGSGGGILLIGGVLVVSNSMVNDNVARRAGGGIEIFDGVLNMFDSDLNDNAVVVAAAPGNGGGLHVTSMTSTIFLTNCNVDGNSAGREGGGLWNQVGVTMNIDSCRITNNDGLGAAAINGGGGVFNNGGDVVITNETVISNNEATGAAGSGGGILSLDGDVDISNSQVNDNIARRAGGGIEIVLGTLTFSDSELNSNDVVIAAAPGNGGGLHITGAGVTATFTNADVMNNMAASEGGGLWNAVGSTLNVDGSLISGNVAQGVDPTNGGGGIFNNGGTLSVMNVTTITSNEATGVSGSGGGVFSTDGVVTIIDSEINNNEARRAGGGIEIIDGTLDFQESDLNNNLVTTMPMPGNGGGLHISGATTATFANANVVGNSAASEGGGLWNSATGTLNVNSSVVTGNVATGVAADNGGGGIFNDGGAMNIDGTQITNNHATGAAGSGGGILTLDGDVVVSNSMINTNSARRAGGGIEIVDGLLNLVTSELNSNDVVTAPAPGNGGGLHVSGMNGTQVNVVASSIMNNEAALEGGGLWNQSGSEMNVFSSTVTGNEAFGDGPANGGGGIFNSGGRLNVGFASMISNNMASGTSGSGGGILSTADSVIITESFVNDNRAKRAGGGIEIIDGVLNMTDSDMSDNRVVLNANPGNGGGLHVSGMAGTVVNIINTTVTSNIAATEGGGLWNQSGSFMNVSQSTITDNIGSGPTANDGGGGVFNNGGTLNITDGTDISSNEATGASGSGGGILSTNGAVTIENSSVNDNDANRAGGGIELIDGSLDMRDSDLSDNRVTSVPNPGNGGGFHITGAASTINFINTTVNNNIAASEGGGLWNMAGSTMNVDSGTTVTNNQALGDDMTNGGGGIFNNGGILNVMNQTMVTDNIASGVAGSGGGIFSTAGPVTITDAVINNNEARRAGGGIEIIDGTLDVSDSELNGNEVIVSAMPGNGGGLHISGMTTIATFTNTDVMNNIAALEGGGLWNQSGSTLNVDSSNVSNNEAQGPAAHDGGGGIFNNGGILNLGPTSVVSNNLASGTAGSGGGILSTNGPLVLDNVMINMNVARRAGGGIEIIDGSLVLTNSELNDNMVVDMAAPGNGGGLHVSGMTTMVSIEDTDVKRNKAALEGGGLWNQLGSTMIVLSSMVSNNEALGAGAANGGGGIFNVGGPMLIADGTMITNNIASGTSGSGGGILSKADSVIITDAVVNNNIARRAGGGIEIIDGVLVMVDSDLNENFVLTAAMPGNGGGLHVSGMSTMTTFINVNVMDNVAAQEGGGLWNQTGSTMVVESSTITGNDGQGPAAHDGGGGIFNSGGTLLVCDGTILDDNHATGLSGSGGAILSTDGMVTVKNTDITNNVARRAGAGIEIIDGTLNVDSSFVDANTITVIPNPGNGGGLHITGDATVANITNSTFSNNIVGSEGGGLWNNGGVMTISNTMVNDNVASGDDATNGGGGVFNDGGTLIINMNTMISNNLADGTSGSGGGVFSTDGAVTIDSTSIKNNIARRAGGGIEMINGSLDITDSELSSNDVVIAAMPGNGGGLHVTGAMSTINIDNSQVVSNDAASEGGGLWNSTGTMNVTNTTLTGNRAFGNAPDNGGGGIFNNGGTLNVSDNTLIFANQASGTAGSGGGVFSTDGDVTIDSSSVTTNFARRAGGGIEVVNGTLTLTSMQLNENVVTVLAAPGNGGGLHISGATLTTIEDSEVMNNIAAQEGGGLWNQINSTMNVSGTTISGNRALGSETHDGGGGIFNNGGDMNIDGQTAIINNRASGTNGGGGGLFSTGGLILMDSTSVDSNTSNGDGGGIYMVGDITTRDVTVNANATDGDGGGIFNVGRTTIIRTNIENNTADANGGGMYSTGAASVLGISRSDILSNVASNSDAVYVDAGQANITRSLLTGGSPPGTDGILFVELGATADVTLTTVTP